MPKKKPKYSLWQNNLFMFRAALARCPGVPIVCIALALTGAAKSTAELLLAPVILSRIARPSSLGQLLAAIGGFSASLLLLSALQAYLNANKLYGRIDVRFSLMTRLSEKRAGTSFPNLLDTAFLDLQKKAYAACSDNQQATEAIWETWTALLQDLLGCAAYLTLLSGIGVLIPLLIAAVSCASFLCTKRVQEWDLRHREEEMRIRSGLNYAYDSAVNRKLAKDIRIFGLRGWILDLWEGSLRLWRAFALRRERAFALASAADVLLTLLRNGVAYVWFLHLAIAGQLTAAQFLLCIGAAGGLAEWVTGMLTQCAQLHLQSLELGALRAFLDRPEPFRFEDGQPLAPAPDAPLQLQLENVSYRYPGAETDTIHNLNLTIRPGEKIAVVGLNGAGKTTLIRLLCGFLDPTGGRVLLCGQDIRQYNRRDYYALFSAVFQEFSVLEASVSENVAQRVDGIDPTRVWRCLEQAGLKEAVRALPRGLETPIGRQVFEDGTELSGGQLQRLMLARALYKNAPILILDEPTAALDPLAEQDIYQKYSAMTAGKTSVFISHRLASTRFCDRILFLEHGRVTEEGTHASLLAQYGGYAALFQVQSRYYQEGDAADV